MKIRNENIIAATSMEQRFIRIIYIKNYYHHQIINLVKKNLTQSNNDDDDDDENRNEWKLKGPLITEHWTRINEKKDVGKRKWQNFFFVLFFLDSDEMNSYSI